jgi:phosphohistidine swiveling domain-containing protein
VTEREPATEMLRVLHFIDTIAWMKTCVYIDGFNLYYGSLKDTPYRWLNIQKMCKLLFPNDNIVKIKYFTAPVKAKGIDVDAPNRQQVYLRAIRTLANVEIIEGFFLSHTVTMKLAHGNGYAQVIKSEEKGTDVNIATHLVHDAHIGYFEKAVVISNDSDLVTPISVVAGELNLPVVVVSPFEKNNIQLKSVATGIKKIRRGLLSVSQFDEVLTDSKGTISIPEKWRNDQLNLMK